MESWPRHRENLQRAQRRTAPHARIRGPSRRHHGQVCCTFKTSDAKGEIRWLQSASTAGFVPAMTRSRALSWEGSGAGISITVRAGKRISAHCRRNARRSCAPGITLRSTMNSCPSVPGRICASAWDAICRGKVLFLQKRQDRHMPQKRSK